MNKFYSTIIVAIKPGVHYRYIWLPCSQHCGASP